MQYQGEAEPPRPVEARILEAAERRIVGRFGEGRAGALEAIRTDPVTRAIFDVAVRVLAEEMRHG